MSHSDPMKDLVQTGLEESGFDFEPSDANLDFMVFHDEDGETTKVHFQTHRFYTPRVIEQFKDVPNVIYAQGPIAAKILAGMLAQGKPERDDPELTRDEAQDLINEDSIYEGEHDLEVAQYRGTSVRIELGNDLAQQKPSEKVDTLPTEWNGNPLSGDQSKALKKIDAWYKDKEADPYFTLRGFPGTGKTTLLSIVAQIIPDFIGTTPTNKATQVLSDKLGVKCSTSYSALGLRMVEDEEGLKITRGGQTPYISKKALFGVDECSMVDKVLSRCVKQTQREMGFKVLATGDPAQLPPVGEKASKSWKWAEKENTAVLKEVVRFDNQILHLSIDIRKNMKDKVWRSPIRDDNDGTEGIFLHSERHFLDLIRERDQVTQWSDCKVIAWTNKQVDHYNNIIRQSLGMTHEWAIGDRIMIGDPIVEYEQIIAHTDDEYEIAERSIVLRACDLEKVECYALGIKNDFRTLTIYVPTRDADIKITQTLAHYATLARGATDKKIVRDCWRKFWAIKRSFHRVRYAYAMTAHRAQGSTLHTTFVDQRNIMKNKGLESLQCLMVACTRSTDIIHSF